MIFELTYRGLSVVENSNEATRLEISFMFSVRPKPKETEIEVRWHQIFWPKVLYQNLEERDI